MKILKLLLRPFSMLYGLGVATRNLLFDKNILRGVRFSVPVISVGNLSVGGTGKTPHIEYLVRLLQQDYKVATMSRGYKRSTKGFLLADTAASPTEIGDEPAQLSRKFPGITVSVCEQRMTGIPRLMGLVPDTEVILLDDAYQHRSVRPGLQILLTSYNQPFYQDHLLPAGRLREQRSGYRRADRIVVTKCPPQLSAADKTRLIAGIRPLPGQSVWFSRLEYGACYNLADHAAFTLPDQASVLLVCGIADPRPLLEHLRPKAAHLELLRYPDHHTFTEKDMDTLRRQVEGLPGREKVVLSTEKDAVRLERFSTLLSSWNILVGVIPITVRFEDEGAFNQGILNYIETAQNE